MGPMACVTLTSTSICKRFHVQHPMYWVYKDAVESGPPGEPTLLGFLVLVGLGFLLCFFAKYEFKGRN